MWIPCIWNMATQMLLSIIVIGEFHWVDVFVHWNCGTYGTLIDLFIFFFFAFFFFYVILMNTRISHLFAKNLCFLLYNSFRHCRTISFEFVWKNFAQKNLKNFYLLIIINLFKCLNTKLQVRFTFIWHIWFTKVHKTPYRIGQTFWTACSQRQTFWNL